MSLDMSPDLSLTNIADGGLGYSIFFSKSQPQGRTSWLLSFLGSLGGVWSHCAYLQNLLVSKLGSSGVGTLGHSLAKLSYRMAYIFKTTTPLKIFWPIVLWIPILMVNLRPFSSGHPIEGHAYKAVREKLFFDLKFRVQQDPKIRNLSRASILYQDRSGWFLISGLLSYVLNPNPAKRASFVSRISWDNSPLLIFASKICHGYTIHHKSENMLMPFEVAE